MKLIDQIKGNKKLLTVSGTFSTVAIAMTPIAFASNPPSTAIVTTDMLTPILTALQDNLSVILPVGIAVFGISIAVSWIPKLFKKFTS